jgi:hypothetical protein
MPPTLDPAKRRVERASQRRTEMIRKLPAALIAIVAMLLLTASSAFAFECYNASRSAKGNAAAAGSPALASPAEILANPDIVGLCPEGVDFVLAGLQDLGYDTNILINERALMAGGLERNGKNEELLHDGKGIDHLGEEFFADVDPLIGEAFATICGE